MQFKPFFKNQQLDAGEVSQDYESSTPQYQYHIGHKAFFIPELFSTSYIPLAAITEVRAAEKSYSAHTCSGSGATTLPVLVMRVNGKVECFQFSNAAQAKAAASLLQERLPQWHKRRGQNHA